MFTCFIANSENPNLVLAVESTVKGSNSTTSDKNLVVATATNLADQKFIIREDGHIISLLTGNCLTRKQNKVTLEPVEEKKNDQIWRFTQEGYLRPSGGVEVLSVEEGFDKRLRSELPVSLANLTKGRHHFWRVVTFVPQPDKKP